MKRNLLFLIVVLLFIGVQSNVLAQAKGKECARPNAELRIGRQATFVSNNLMLDDETSESFKTLYIQYLKELQKCMLGDHSFDLSKWKKNGKDKMTDAQIEQMIQLRFDKCRDVLVLREQYFQEFKKILTPRQILRMYVLERNFGKQVQNELEKRNNKKQKR